LFCNSDILIQSEENIFNPFRFTEIYIYEYLPYNNLAKQDKRNAFFVTPFTTWPQMIIRATHNFSDSSSLRKSKWIQIHHINPIPSEVVVCLHLQKHIYEHFSYNNLANTRLAQDVLCNTIYYMTTNESQRNAS
jgi:hypothetical protein